MAYSAFDQWVGTPALVHHSTKSSVAEDARLNVFLEIKERAVQCIARDSSPTQALLRSVLAFA